MRVSEIDKLNAVATMVINSYRKKLKAMTLIVVGLVILYMITVLAFVQSLSRQTETCDTTIGMAAPIAVIVSRFNVVPRSRRILVNV